MTKENFKEWLQQSVADQENRIGKEELRQALRALGINNSSTSWKASRALKHCDLNRDGFIKNEEEIDALIEYAGRRWGFMVQ